MKSIAILLVGILLSAAGICAQTTTTHTTSPPSVDYETEYSWTYHDADGDAHDGNPYVSCVKVDSVEFTEWGGSGEIGDTEYSVDYDSDGKVTISFGSHGKNSTNDIEICTTRDNGTDTPVIHDPKWDTPDP